MDSSHLQVLVRHLLRDERRKFTILHAKQFLSASTCHIMIMMVLIILFFTSLLTIPPRKAPHEHHHLKSLRVGVGKLFKVWHSFVVLLEGKNCEKAERLIF